MKLKDIEDLVRKNKHKLNEDNHKQTSYPCFIKIVQLLIISFVSASQYKRINKASTLVILVKD